MPPIPFGSGVSAMRCGTSNSSAIGFLLELTLQGREPRGPRLRVLADPALVDEPDRHWVQEMELLSAPLAGDDEIRLLQHLEVLHHAEARHRQATLEGAERLPVLLEEPVEQLAPGRIAERLEHLVHGSRVYVTFWSPVKRTDLPEQRGDNLPQCPWRSTWSD